MEENKNEQPLKGKQKKIAKAKAAKGEKKAPKQKRAVENIPNYGKCVTCVHFPHKIRGCAQPCKITGSYVARKCDKCPKNSYKCKFES